MKCLLLLTCLLLNGALAHAQDWRGIKPLRSTCEDVKRILGVNSCDASVFQLENETVNIDFARKPCADGWNVPAGTVISLTVYPKTKPRLAELKIDKAAYEKAVPSDQPDKLFLLNKREGVILSVATDGTVDHITFGPTEGDRSLRYTNSLADYPETASEINSSLLFARSAQTEPNKFKETLTNFAAALRQERSMNAFVIVYGGRRSFPHEAQTHAEVTRNFLIANGIDPSRVQTMDGGYQEERTIELYLRPKNSGPPMASPTICPSEVQITKGLNVRNKR